VPKHMENIMRELKNTELKTVAGGNPPPGSPGNGADAIRYGVATFRATGNAGRAIAAGLVRFVT